MLRYADEGNLIAFEDFEHASEVHQRAAQSVDLVDDHAIHLAGFDVRQQLPERWTIHIAAGEATVVITIRKALPAFVTLADDVRFARFTLGVERVELLVESFFRRLPGVDRTANDVAGRFVTFASGPSHRAPTLPSRKKWNPLQCWPVIALATPLSDL